MNSGLGGVGGDTCYDSLEDLRRGQGLRRLPPLPNSKTTTSLQSSLVAEDWSKDSLLSPSSSFGLHDATISPTAANNNNDSLEDLSSLVEDPPPASAKKCITQRRSLVRSQTFAASPVEGMRAAPHQRRRQLPDIPAVGGGEGLSFLSADDPGLQLLLLRQPQQHTDVDYQITPIGRRQPGWNNKDHHMGPGNTSSRNDPGFFSLSDERTSDSGCPSLDLLGEETCVDPPPPSQQPALLPRRNPSNFLWVDLDRLPSPPAEAEDNGRPGTGFAVKRRPKNHERLAARCANRHSAPPGSLDSFVAPPPEAARVLPLPKRSLQEPRAGGRRSEPKFKMTKVGSSSSFSATSRGAANHSDRMDRGFSLSFNPPRLSFN